MAHTVVLVKVSPWQGGNESHLAFSSSGSVLVHSIQIMSFKSHRCTHSTLVWSAFSLSA